MEVHHGGLTITRLGWPRLSAGTRLIGTSLQRTGFALVIGAVVACAPSNKESHPASAEPEATQHHGQTSADKTEDNKWRPITGD